jgi:hypothetical protein
MFEEYVMYGIEKRTVMIRRDKKKRAFLLLSFIGFIGGLPYW